MGNTSTLQQYGSIALVSSKKNLPYYHVGRPYSVASCMHCSVSEEDVCLEYDGLLIAKSAQFFMEVLPRIATVLPLLHAHPEIGIALDTKILLRYAPNIGLITLL